MARGGRESRVEASGGAPVGAKISNSTRNKIFAILAGGLVLGVGGTATLAAWVDNEWVYGGTGGDTPGVGTSTFIVEQDARSPFTNPGVWGNFATNPGDELTFGPADPLAITPGDPPVYAPVALHTTTASISGDVQLQPAVAATGVTVNDTGGALFAALDLRIGWVEVDDTGTPPICNSTTMGDGTYAIIADGTGLATAASGPQAIQAAGAANLHYCFEISLADGAPSTLMGRTVAPAWQFISTSD